MSRSNSSGIRCALCSCNSMYIMNYFGCQNSYFSFPKDPKQCALWIEKCNPSCLPTTDTGVLSKKYKLCSLHFEDKMFSNFQKNRLYPSAVPTLFESIITQTTSVVKSCSIDEVKDEPIQCTTLDDAATSTDTACSQTTSVVECCSLIDNETKDVKPIQCTTSGLNIIDHDHDYYQNIHQECDSINHDHNYFEIVAETVKPELILPPVAPVRPETVFRIQKRQFNLIIK